MKQASHHATHWGKAETRRLVAGLRGGRRESWFDGALAEQDQWSSGGGRKGWDSMSLLKTHTLQTERDGKLYVVYVLPQ